IIKYLLKISKKAHILELRRRHFEDYYSDILYAVSIKEDTAYLCLHFTKDHEGNKINTPYPEKINTPKFYKKREFCSSRKFYKTLSLDESRSPVLNLFSDREENSEEEITETMEQYMSKTRADYGSGEVILFYNILEVPTRQILDTKGAIPTKTVSNAKVAIQEIREIKKVNEKVYAAQVGCEQCKGPHYTKDSPLKKDGKTLEEAYYTQFDVAIHNQGELIKTLEIQIRQMSKVVQERGFGSLPSYTETNPRDYVKLILTTIEADTNLIHHFVILDMPEDVTVPLILRRPFLSTAHAKIDVFKRKITLRVREENIIFKSIKPASSLIKRVYMIGLRERIELDLEDRLTGETLVLNRLLDPFFEDYIELNDLNVPLELKRDQVDDLMPPIKEGEVVEEFRVRNDARIVSKIFRYPIDCDHDKKIRIDYAYNLKFSCMIGKDKLEYKGNNVVGTLINIPIFVGTFSILTDFTVLDDMDAYRDEGMGDVIFGELFLREVGINVKRFEGMITIYNGNEEVIYQIVWSHPRFKYHTNKQCNKIPPLMKVSEEDKLNGISHSYQKLKSFYKGVLN
nr:hypothetical protein [Tanacetum cinerariifolium]